MDRLYKTAPTGELEDEIERWKHHGGLFDLGRRAELIDMLITEREKQVRAVKEAPNHELRNV